MINSIKIFILIPLFLLFKLSCFSQTHEYTFNNTLNAFGAGPALTQTLACGAANGAFSTQTITLTGGTTCAVSNAFCFNAGGGLRYPNPSFITSQYSINLFFKFNTIGGWSRIIDFSNSTADAGIYLNNNCLNFFPNGNIGTCPFFAANIYYLFTFVLNGATNVISTYVNGNLFGTYTDAGNLYRPATNTTPIIFFKDDVAVPCEAKAGCVRYATISSSTMSAVQVLSTFTNICNVILPVELSSFNAIEEEKRVKLEWTTLSEKNSSSFEIESSTDGIEYNKIGELKARGNSQNITNYQSYDNYPKRGINYYRLKQIDIDGTFSYSSVLYVNFENETPLFYPNPANDILYLNHEFKGKLVIKNIIGEKLLEVYNQDEEYIKISEFPPGTYFVQINDKVQKLIISR